MHEATKNIQAMLRGDDDCNWTFCLPVSLSVCQSESQNLPQAPRSSQKLSEAPRSSHALIGAPMV